MPLGGALSLGLAAATGGMQLYTGIKQNGQAKRVRLRDITPLAIKEELASSRLAANNQRLPGMGQATDNINAGLANSYNNAIQAGRGSAGILASLARLDANRNLAFSQLANQGAQFQLGQQNRLSQNLRQQGAYQQQDRDNYNREKAALTEARDRNIFGGVSTIAGAGITGLTGGFGAQTALNKRIATGDINPYTNSETNINNAPTADFWNNPGRPYWQMFDLPGSKSYKPQY